MAPSDRHRFAIPRFVVVRSTLGGSRGQSAWPPPGSGGSAAARRIEFVAAVGIRHDVPSGVALVQRGRRTNEVHLIRHGAAAVIGDQKGRRPILSFVVPGEFCCALPAPLGQRAAYEYERDHDGVGSGDPPDATDKCGRPTRENRGWARREAPMAAGCAEGKPSMGRIPPAGGMRPAGDGRSLYRANHHHPCRPCSSINYACGFYRVWSVSIVPACQA